MKRHTLSAAFVGAVLMLVLTGTGNGAALSGQRQEPVTIILRNGDKIRATILDIWGDRVVFKAASWRDAYEYGEVLGVGQITAIELKNGRRMTVDEYADYRNGRSTAEEQQEKKPPAAVPGETRISDRVVVTRSPAKSASSEEIDQYELLKRKPISEMTDREFQFFMMMKKRELERERIKEQLEIERQQRQLVPQKPTEEAAAETKEGLGSAQREPETRMRATRPALAGTSSRLPGSRFGLRLPPPTLDQGRSQAADQIARLLIESDLAGPFLKFVAERRGESLTPFQQKVISAVESSPDWKDRVEQVEYLRRVASKAFERVYLYEPESLKKNLGLIFDENADMNFDDLLGQLHAKLGNDVNMGDLRTLVDVLGEGGARAVRDLLRNFDTYRYVTAAGDAVAQK